MKYIKSILSILCCIVIISTNFAQRNIILSHGFGGDDNTWNVYHPKLRSMLITPTDIIKASYDSKHGVDAGSIEVAGKVANNAQNIAIAHSMGGLVWRNLDNKPAQTGQKAGGIITLGTPNRGGSMMNAMRDGRLNVELNTGCNKVGNAISSALTVMCATYLVGTVVGAVFGDTRGLQANRIVGESANVLDFFQQTLCSLFVFLANQDLPTNTAPLSLRDMAVGSDLINHLNINNVGTPTPKIGLFGVEESPVHIRLFGSYKNSPSSKPLDVSNTDEAMVSDFNLLNDVVAVGEVIFVVAALVYSVNALWNWSSLRLAVICAWAAYEWDELRRWLCQSESRWHALIGAGGFYTERTNFRFFSCTSALDDAYDLYDRRRITAAQLRLIETRLYADPNCFTTAQTSIQYAINNQSDGLFNAGVTRIPEDPNDRQHVVNLPVERANHQELVNHRNMTIRFKEIFSGQTGAHPFFRTL